MSKLFCSFSVGFNRAFYGTSKFLLILCFCEALLLTQEIFTCSRSTIETLEKKVRNMFKVNNRNTRT